ncbi:MAG: hypothetical protein ACP5PX_03415 [Candidatus Hadarchaeum sp.]|uniref:hypothetical protein n=1 Tax=Candidatus Hadarchaeum sp. TaxID=2883567 RepID=UPI003D131F16
MTTGSAETWTRALELLRSIRIDRERLSEVEKMVNQLLMELENASGRGALYNPRDVHEQLQVLVRLSCAIERLSREMEELERIEKKMQLVEKRIEMDLRTMEQIREQLKKKLQIVVKEEKSELKTGSQT